MNTAPPPLFRVRAEYDDGQWASRYAGSPSEVTEIVRKFQIFGASKIERQVYSEVDGAYVQDKENE